MKKIMVVSHCILNTASKVKNNNNIDFELLKEENRKKFLHYAIENDINILQLPCPEFGIYGSRRWGHVKEQFTNPFYKKQCNNMLESIIHQIKEYATYPNEYHLMGIIAIDGSPSCGYNKTCRGNCCGELPSTFNEFENTHKSIYMSNESGVFMEQLDALLKQENIKIKIMDLSYFVDKYII